MDDMQAIEQRITRELLRRAGPSEPVDDAAIFTAITATQSPKWRFESMFSATKFAVAGAIVALFGGFLLAGVLTQPSEERLPVGASASATVVTTAEPTTEDRTETSIRSDLLPGVELVTEEVEPGVYRVVSDGVGDIEGNVLVGLDGSVLIFGGPDCGRRDQDAPCQARRLGDRELLPLMQGPRVVEVIEVGSDGTIWAATYVPERDNDDLRTWDGEQWVKRVDDVGFDATRRSSIAVGADGRVLVLEVTDGERRLVEPGDGARTLPDMRLDRIHTSIDGSLIVVNDTEHWWRLTSGGIEPFGVWIEPTAELYDWIGLSPDGVAWWLADQDRETGNPRTLASFDGEAWQSFAMPDGIPWYPLGVTRDGSVWLGQGAAPTGLPFGDGSSDGLYRFDGSAWTTFFPDEVVGGLDEDANGMLWVTSEGSLFVITPEAVAATE